MIFNRENTRAERFVQQSPQVYWLRNLKLHNTVGILMFPKANKTVAFKTTLSVGNRIGNTRNYTKSLL